MPTLVIEKQQFSSLVSPVQNQKIPVFNWHTFKHSFSKELVDNILEEFKIKEGDWILDPFCGGGTTLLAAKQKDVNSLGIDILPFSAYLSYVKTRNYDSEKLKKNFKIFLNRGNDKIVKKILPDILIVRKAFSEKVKDELLIIKELIESIKDDKIRNFFNLAFLSILESVSNTSKAGGFLRIVERDITPSQVYDLFLKKSRQMIEDIVLYNEKVKNYRNAFVDVKIGDARRLPTKRKFDAIITSPPYPNRHDYTRIYSLEMIFDFISSNEELKKLRYNTLRSHVEAKKRYEVTGYNKPQLLEELLIQIKKNGTNNPQVIGMLEGYFEDMFLSLLEMNRCLKTQGKIALVVSNVRFSGINIPVDEILANLGEQAGLKPEAIWAARYRGNSSQQMQQYKKKPSRESIIIWQKE